MGEGRKNGKKTICEIYAIVVSWCGFLQKARFTTNTALKKS